MESYLAQQMQDHSSAPSDKRKLKDYKRITNFIRNKVAPISSILAPEFW